MTTTQIGAKTTDAADQQQSNGMYEKKYIIMAKSLTLRKKSNLNYRYNKPIIYNKLIITHTRVIAYTRDKKQFFVYAC